jgi:Fe/S biogenesis protein NfuA
VLGIDGFQVYMDPESAQLLDRATVDYVDGLMGSGFKIERPRQLPEHLSGDLAQRVHEVIEKQINPAVAAHGGMITLMDIRNNAVYVQLGGGCQGCGMANVTLKEGIVRMIKEAVPEVQEVVDVTDHASGENPYY